MKKRIRLEPIFCTILLLAVTGAAGIIAYQTDASTVRNQMIPGWNESEITEDFPDPDPIIPEEPSKIVKKVAVTNTAGVPCYVRVLMKSSNSDIPLKFLYQGEEGYHTDDWTLGEDGYYYYNHILEEGESSSYLIDSVAIGGEEDLSDYWEAVSEVHILVYAETVQARNADTGTYWESCQAAWEYYLSTIG